MNERLEPENLQTVLQMRLRLWPRQLSDHTTKHQLGLGLPFLADTVPVQQERRDGWVIMLQIGTDPLSGERSPYYELAHA